METCIIKGEDGEIYAVLSSYRDARITMTTTWNGKGKVKFDCRCIPCKGSGDIGVAFGNRKCCECKGKGKNPDKVLATAPDGSTWILETHTILQRPIHL